MTSSPPQYTPRIHRRTPFSVSIGSTLSGHSLSRSIDSHVSKAKLSSMEISVDMADSFTEGTDVTGELTLSSQYPADRFIVRLSVSSFACKVALIC